MLSDYKCVPELSCYNRMHCFNGDHSDVFLLSCRDGQLEVVKFLIEVAKCDPQCVDHEGKTPLHDACRYLPSTDCSTVH